jgi:hypothetical protein
MSKPHIRRYSMWSGYWVCGMHSQYVADGYDYVAATPLEAFLGWASQFK